MTAEREALGFVPGRHLDQSRQIERDKQASEYLETKGCSIRKPDQDAFCRRLERNLAEGGAVAGALSPVLTKWEMLYDCLPMK